MLKNNHCDAANFSANLSSETPALLLVTTSRGSDFVTDANCPATTAFNRSINNGNSSSLTNEFGTLLGWLLCAKKLNLTFRIGKD